MAATILDIDGVFNAFYGPAFLDSTDPKYAVIADYDYHWVTHSDGSRTKVFMNLDLMKEAVKKLSSLSTLVWGTKWQKRDAQDLLSMLGLDDELEAIEIKSEDVGLGTWKIRSVVPFIETLDDDEKVVWVEDELEGDAFKYAETRGNMLCICPNQVFGLTAEQIQEIVDFLS